LLDSLKNSNPVLLALLGGFFTYLVTLIGSALVFFVKKESKKLLDASLGFAAGVMIAASFWSLLAPAIEISGGKWHPALIGFLLGSFFLYILDKVIPHLHPGLSDDKKEGFNFNLKRITLFVFAVTLHNIPEGLAVGVTFGAMKHIGSNAFFPAVAVTLGIGIQNFPEGFAISIPLRGEGISRTKSFFYGQLSGIVEPFSAVLGAFFVSIFSEILPYALAFAAGAMIYVVVEEIIPEAQRSGNSDIATISSILGFAVMMVLDVALG